MNFQKTIITGLLLIFAFSCKKEVTEEYRPEFIGYWIGDRDDWHCTLNIDKSGDGTFTLNKNDCCSKEKIKSGKVRATDNILKVGLWSFKIKEYPNRIDTTTSNMIVPTGPNSWPLKKAAWKMTLEHSFFGPTCDAIYYRAE